MALNHDADSGFLRGDSIADEIDDLSQQLKLLQRIEANSGQAVTLLRKLVQQGPAAQPSPARAPYIPTLAPGAANDPSPPVPRPAPGPAVDPARPGSRTRPADVSADALPAPTPATRPGPSRAPEQAGRRDRSGRFTGPDESSAPSSTATDGAKSISSSIADAARDIGSKMTADVNNVDPTIEAAKEVGSMLSPVTAMLKPIGGLFKSKGEVTKTKQHRESVSWLRKIWRGQADANRGGKSGGMLGLLMGALSALLAPLMALGRMMGALRGVAALAGLLKGAGRLAGLGGGRRARNDGPGSRDRRRSAGGTGERRTLRNRAGGGADTHGPDAGSSRRGAPGAPGSAGSGSAGGERNSRRDRNARGAGNPANPGESRTAGGRAGARSGKGLGGMLKGLGKGAGGLATGALRKLPVIGALLSGAMIASSLMADDDPELSAEENKKKRYGNVGSGVGAVLGGVAGLIGGPVGAMAGAWLGEQVGEKIGTWLATVDLGSIPGTISDAFGSLADTTMALASSAFDSVKDGWKSLLDIGSKTFSSLTDWAKNAWNKTTEAVAQVKDTVNDKVQTAKDYVGEKAATVQDKGQNLLNRVTGGRYQGGSNAAKDEMIKAMDAGGITDPNSKAALMANADHESGGFKRNEENLNYSAKRLQEVFPKYYQDAESARKDAGNPEAIANKVYGGRMGNTEEGDGYKYRGRGNLQLTGKAQYEEMGKKLGIDLVNNPDLAMDPKYSAQIAVQHWKSSGADKAAQSGDFLTARKRTNGGTNGLADVNSKMDGYLTQAKAGDLTPTRRADEVKVQAPAAASAAIASTMATVGKAKQNATPAMMATATAPIGVLAPVQTKAAAATPSLLSAGVSPGLAPVADPAKPATVTPIGILAPTQPRAVAPAAAASIPATLAAPKASSYAAPVADASKTRIPSMAEVKAPSVSSGKDAPPTVSVEVPLSQNVNDRGIAHAASGGIGMFNM